jgi:hypothetical protein
MKLFLGILGATLLATLVNAGELTISLRDRPAMVFANGRQSVPVLIENRGETTKVSLDYRVFQLTSSIAAPLGDRVVWKEIPLNGGQLVLEQLPLALPAVKAPTAFAVKVFESKAPTETASLVVHAYPTDLLSELKVFLKDHQLALSDEADKFAPTLAKAGIEFVRVKNLSDPILADKPVLLVISVFAANDIVADLSKVTTGVVHLTRGSLPDLRRLPIEGYSKNNAFIVQCEPPLFDNFPNSPSAQINFIRSLRYALRRETEAAIKQ